ncbi:class I SAM-dependent methyltransferase [Corynebacterium epidermidicanis]|uniref:Methyltransferase family protein n=1 Tax=Corynebacterium epidermidicanis TaxID=1050174 RepID=A0A0G3GVV3_9CORY|nr:class I SAM-dependent methyltransferase [Corynebacterium epidermidicanis]AKK03007.1 methyltransferase family protein [Corynebacterium epidermidicanis]
MSSSFSAANRAWWDSDSQIYHQSHESYLSSFYWCPEMLHEKDVRLLGNVADKRVLEIGCGSAPCANWLYDDGVEFITAFDISWGMLSHSTGNAPLVQADALAMPFADNSFDVVFSAFGAIPFVESSLSVLDEAARVLKRGGRFVMSINHPMRWIFADDPESFEVQYSYFDREGYTEFQGERLTYAEQHRTLGDRIRELLQAGFVLDDLIEPEWPVGLTENWGQWSPNRGRVFPGTAIFVAHLA